MKRFVSVVLVFVLFVGCFSVIGYAEDGIELTDEQQSFYDAVVRDDGSVTFDEIVDVMNSDYVLGSKILDYYDSVAVPLDGNNGSDVAVHSDMDEWGGTVTYNIETGQEMYSDDADLVEMVESDMYQAEQDVSPCYELGAIFRPDKDMVGKTVYKLYICSPNSSVARHEASAF